jgi:hypothetical protein
MAEAVGQVVVGYDGSEPAAAVSAALATARFAAATQVSVARTRRPRSGAAAARNAALERVGRADLFLFLDDDVVPADGWLEAYLEWYERRGTAPCAWGPTLFLDRNGGLDETLNKTDFLLPFVLPLAGTPLRWGVSANMAVVGPINGLRFREELSIGEDVEIGCRLTEIHGWGVGVPSACVFHLAERGTLGHCRRFFTYGYSEPLLVHARYPLDSHLPTRARRLMPLEAGVAGALIVPVVALAGRNAAPVGLAWAAGVLLGALSLAARRPLPLPGRASVPAPPTFCLRFLYSLSHQAGRLWGIVRFPRSAPWSTRVFWPESFQAEGWSRVLSAIRRNYQIDRAIALAMVAGVVAAAFAAFWP